MTNSELSRQPARPSRLLKWFNAGAHAISAIVLLYAFIFNGEKSRAMINPVAMKGEVNLGLFVGSIFLIRFLWVRSRRSANGRWAPASLRSPSPSTIRQLTDWSIYLLVAATVFSGLLIAYLRPGVQLIPGNRFFLTRSPTLNATIRTHVFVSNALEWLCAFHVAYFLWFWKIKKTRWGKISEDWLDQLASAADRMRVFRLVRKKVTAYRPPAAGQNS
jgi:cytochrome b561